MSDASKPHLPQPFRLVQSSYAGAWRAITSNAVVAAAHTVVFLAIFLIWQVGPPLLRTSALTFVSATWLAAVLRTVLGRSVAEVSPARSRLGVDEARLLASSLAVGFALTIVAFLLFLFLIIFSMIMVAVAGYDGDTLDQDPTFFQNPENVAAFLATTEGVVLGVVALACVAALFWLVCRLSPFAAGVVAQRRIVALQAIVWTRYQDLRLCLAAFGGVLLPLAGSGIGLAWLAVAGLPVWGLALVKALMAVAGVALSGAFSAQIYRHLVDVPGK